MTILLTKEPCNTNIDNKSLPLIPPITPLTLLPLVVDLDGTLTPTDTLWESLWQIIRRNPTKFLTILNYALTSGFKLTGLKRKVFELANPQNIVDSIPWNKAIIKYINEEYKMGRVIVLATASNIEMAKLVQKKFPFFKEILGSTSEMNLKDKNKASVLVEKFGKKGFDYIGNDYSDIAVWKVANKAHLASSLLNPLLQTKLDPTTPISTTFSLKEKRIKIIIKALRVKQWSKNLLVFAPMIASHAYLNPEKWWIGILTFISFSLCASGAYMLNDLIDIDHDRNHHKKYTRPIAQGYLPIPLAITLAVVLPLLGLGLSISLGIGIYIFIYLVTTVLYSIYLKQVAIVDIACLAGLYCLRIITGGVSTSEPVSFWMAAFGGFLFVSLACIKRQAELLNLSKEEKEDDHDKTKGAKGRGYNTNDIALTRNIGVATGCIAPLVLALYLEGNQGDQFYAHPEYLWGACGLIFIWIMSLWRETEQMRLKDEDPISYSITNPKSIILLLLLVVTLVLATYVP